MPKKLAKDQIEQFQEMGYVKGVRVLDVRALRELQEKFHVYTQELRSKGLTHNDVNGWWAVNSYIFGVYQTPAVLDCFQDLLGENLMIWGGQFFAKQPRDDKTVPWHQDSQYWPISPREHCVSGWIALFDTDASNGCMQVIPGTHRRILRHAGEKKQTDVLGIVISPEEIDPKDAVDIDLKAGEMSLHTDAIVHGSGPNPSDRIRCGLTMRVSSDDLEVDRGKWKDFFWIPLRGKDRFGRNPVRQPPTEASIPSGFIQFAKS